MLLNNCQRSPVGVLGGTVLNRMIKVGITKNAIERVIEIKEADAWKKVFPTRPVAMRLE